MAKFDLRIVAVLIFIWGVLNTTSGYNDLDWLNFSKGLVAIILAGYLYYHSSKLVILSDGIE